MIVGGSDGVIGSGLTTQFSLIPGVFFPPSFHFLISSGHSSRGLFQISLPELLVIDGHTTLNFVELFPFTFQSTQIQRQIVIKTPHFCSIFYNSNNICLKKIEGKCEDIFLSFKTKA